MSEADNPFAPMFAVQRRAAREGLRAFHRQRDLQRRSFEVFFRGLDRQHSLQEKSVDLTRTAAMAYLDALETTTPGGEPTFERLRELADDGFESAGAFDEQLWAAFERTLSENLDAADEFADQYAQFVDESVEAYVDALEELEGQSWEGEAFAP